MNKLLEKPHYIFWMPIPPIILFGLWDSNKMLDINVHDTYFIISQMYVVILTAGLFGVIGFGYWSVLRTTMKLSKWLTFIHIALTFGGIILILILAQQFRDSILEYDFNTNLTMMIYSTIFVMIVAQLLYSINIISALFKRINKSCF